MPFFTLPIDADGPILNLVVAVTEERIEALTKAGQPIPQPQVIRAMIDTGASHLHIDPRVFHALQLTPTGQTTVNTASSGDTPHVADQYDVAIAIPGAAQDHPPLILGTVPATTCDLRAVPGFNALIGRHVLNNCVLIYNGSSGVFTLAY
ncbi:MAG TPA: aspartyl protease family protein [Gemmatimonadaceae bacterium]|jgi:hypothetical protein|nr:aspartyl protease family protein [Gemmatimonadaceae bacterium]